MNDFPAISHQLYLIFRLLYKWLVAEEFVLLHVPVSRLEPNLLLDFLIFKILVFLDPVVDFVSVFHLVRFDLLFLEASDALGIKMFTLGNREWDGRFTIGLIVLIFLIKIIIRLIEHRLLLRLPLRYLVCNARLVVFLMILVLRNLGVRIIKGVRFIVPSIPCSRSGVNRFYIVVDFLDLVDIFPFLLNFAPAVNLVDEWRRSWRWFTLFLKELFFLFLIRLLTLLFLMNILFVLTFERNMTIKVVFFFLDLLRLEFFGVVFIYLI